MVQLIVSHIIRRVENTIAILLISKFVLRSVAQFIRSRKNEVEVLALVIVESEIKELLFTCTHRIHETQLVETDIGLIG